MQLRVESFTSPRKIIFQLCTVVMKNCYYSSTDRMTSDRQSDVGEFNWKRVVVNVDLMTSKSYFFFSPFNHSLHSNIGMDSSSGENVKILYIFSNIFHFTARIVFISNCIPRIFCCFNSGIVFILLLCNADGGYCIASMKLLNVKKEMLIY